MPPLWGTNSKNSFDKFKEMYVQNEDGEVINIYGRHSITFAKLKQGHI